MCVIRQHDNALTILLFATTTGTVLVETLASISNASQRVPVTPNVLPANRATAVAARLLWVIVRAMTNALLVSNATLAAICARKSPTTATVRATTRAALLAKCATAPRICALPLQNAHRVSLLKKKKVFSILNSILFDFIQITIAILDSSAI